MCEYIPNKYIYHHHGVPQAWISLALSRYSSLWYIAWYIAFSRSSIFHPVPVQSSCREVLAGLLTISHPCERIHINVYVWIYIHIFINIYEFITAHILVDRVFAKGTGDRGSYPGRVLLKIKIWYLIPPYFTLSIIRYIYEAKVKQSLENSNALLYTNWKGSLRVAFDVSRQLYLLFVYIHIYEDY